MTMWGLLVLLFFSLSPARADDMSMNAKAYLDRHYPGWALAPINRDAEQYFKGAGWHGTPNFFSYDFDGDKVEDLAVQIQYPKGQNKEEADLVLLETPSVIKEFVLETHPADPVHRSVYFIRPIFYGETLTDYKGRPISFNQNGVELVTFQKEATAYFFEGGTLRKIHTLNLH